MTTAWTSSRSISGSNEDHLMTRQSGFVSNHELELPKRPAMELRTLLSTAPLTAFADTAQVFQHNETIRGKTIDEATAHGMQVVACPTAFLIAEPCPSFFSSRAFALQDTPSGTEPLAPLDRFYTRNSNTVGSNKQINLTEVNTDNTLRWVARFWDWDGNRDMQVEFTIPMTLENSRSGFRSFEDWEVSLSDFDSALDSFTVASSDARPDSIAHQEQSEKSCVQIQRLGFEGKRFQGLLFCFGSFIRFCNTANGTGGIISVEVEPLPDIVVDQMVQSDGVGTSLGECYLADVVADVSEDIQRSVESLFIFCRQVQFADNGQLHRLYYTTHARICQGGELFRQ